MSEASGIPAWCYVGAKVVYVGYHGPDAVRSPTQQKHKSNAIYTVADVGIGGLTGLVWIRTVELPKRSPTNLRCFRPAVPPKTQSEDVGLFRHHLDDVRADA